MKWKPERSLLVPCQWDRRIHTRHRLTVLVKNYSNSILANMLTKQSTVEQQPWHSAMSTRALCPWRSSDICFINKSTKIKKKGYQTAKAYTQPFRSVRVTIEHGKDSTDGTVALQAKRRAGLNTPALWRRSCSSKLRCTRRNNIDAPLTGL